MKWLSWPDNTCTVGWTSFHAYLNKADRDAIQLLCPEVLFRGTFFPSIPSQRDDLHEKGYYIDLPEERVPVLLAMLSLECGRIPKRGEPTDRFHWGL